MIGSSTQPAEAYIVANPVVRQFQSASPSFQSPLRAALPHAHLYPHSLSPAQSSPLAAAAKRKEHPTRMDDDDEDTFANTHTRTGEHDSDIEEISPVQHTPTLASRVPEPNAIDVAAQAKASIRAMMLGALPIKPTTQSVQQPIVPFQPPVPATSAAAIGVGSIAGRSTSSPVGHSHSPAPVTATAVNVTMAQPAQAFITRATPVMAQVHAHYHFQQPLAANVVMAHTSAGSAGTMVPARASPVAVTVMASSVSALTSSITAARVVAKSPGRSHSPIPVTATAINGAPMAHLQHPQPINAIATVTHSVLSPPSATFSMSPVTSPEREVVKDNDSDGEGIESNTITSTTTTSNCTATTTETALDSFASLALASLPPAELSTTLTKNMNDDVLSAFASLASHSTSASSAHSSSPLTQALINNSSDIDSFVLRTDSPRKPSSRTPSHSHNSSVSELPNKRSRSHSTASHSSMPTAHHYNTNNHSPHHSKSALTSSASYGSLAALAHLAIDGTLSTEGVVSSPRRRLLGSSKSFTEEKRGVLKPSGHAHVCT